MFSAIWIGQSKGLTFNKDPNSTENKIFIDLNGTKTIVGTTSTNEIIIPFPVSGTNDTLGEGMNGLEGWGLESDPPEPVNYDI